MPTDLIDRVTPAPPEALAALLLRLARWLGTFSDVCVCGAVYGPPDARRVCADGLWVSAEAHPAAGCGLPPSGEWCELAGALVVRDGRLVLVVRSWRLSEGGA